MQIFTRVSRETAAALEELAEKRGVTSSELVRLAVSRLVKPKRRKRRS